MDKTQLIDAIQHSAEQLAAGWMAKLAASALVAALTTHMRLLGAFALLVIIDLITKWAELTRQYLADKGKTDVTLWQILCFFNGARKAGYIKSDVMKHRFLGKMCVYIVFTLGAGALDLILKTLESPQFAVALTVGYLAVTEFLSILENLQGAGVEEAKGLHDIVEKKNHLK